jgi:hypothetical protein
MKPQLTTLLTPDKVCEYFSTEHVELTLRTLDEDTMLLAGSSESLRFLAQLLLAVAEANDTGFQISPTGAGHAFFSSESSHGVYIHRVKQISSKLNNGQVNSPILESVMEV